MSATTVQHDFTLLRIRLELAREPGHPLGSHAFGYEIVAPINAEGRLSVDGWRLNRDRCRAVRVRPGEDHRIGQLLRRPGGSWAIRYADGNDEVGVHFGQERFALGDYVTLRIDDQEHTFKVIAAEPL